ncbi:MAG: hypothetical protein HQ518_20635 [Rhodopirellula sp.]|nr:hypothetical protein [Rhodopirellula sp.]
MRRQFFGLISFCFLLTLIGCGDKTKVEPTDTATTGTSEVAGTTGSETASGESTKTLGSSAKGDPSADPHQGHSHAKEPVGRDTFDGSWLLAFPQLVPPQQEGQELKAGERAVLLFKVDGADGDSPTMSVITGRQGLEQVEFRDVEISDGTIRFRAESQQGDKIFDFSGKLKHGLVIGSTLFVDGNLALSRLLPTEEKTFARIPTLIPLPETQMFIALGTSPVPDEDTRAFVEMIPVSPLGRMAYIRLINMTAGNKAPVADLERVINEFTSAMADWGDRAVTYAEFESFSAIAMSGYDVNWCLARADEIEAKLKENDDLKRLALQVSGLRTQIKYRQTTELLRSADKDDLAKGRELAEEFLTKTPFEPVLSALLADDAREHDRPDEAIRRYAELVAFPMQERMLQQFWTNETVQKILPTERLAALWKTKHGGTEGLDEYISQVYEQNLLSFADSPIEATQEDADKHTVLCELFTGARCAPCVSADVGLEGIEKTYPKSQVITLRYHVHVPGHDPLANDDCEARFYNYYKASGTPSLFVDGQALGGVAGLMPNVPQTYRGLRNVIDEFRGDSKVDDETVEPAADKPAASVVDEKADSGKDEKPAAETDDAQESPKSDAKVAGQVEPKVTIELQVSRQQDTIQVSATVNGLTPENGNARLMLVLAESGIKYQAFNGIRHHDMVVRQLIGGDRGVGPKDGVLSFQGDVNVEGLRERLHSYLTTFEENQGVEFTSMPLALKHLSVVAFVQDVESQKVLHSVIAPVADTAAEK